MTCKWAIQWVSPQRSQLARSSKQSRLKLTVIDGIVSARLLYLRRHQLDTLSNHSSLRFAILQIDQAAATAAKNTVAMPMHIAQATKARNRWSLEMHSKRGDAGGSGALCIG